MAVGLRMTLLTHLLLIHLLLCLDSRNILHDGVPVRCYARAHSLRYLHLHLNIGLHWSMRYSMWIGRQNAIRLASHDSLHRRCWPRRIASTSPYVEMWICSDHIRTATIRHSWYRIAVWLHPVALLSGLRIVLRRLSSLVIISQNNSRYVSGRNLTF